jgi:hypothetical protein
MSSATVLFVIRHILDLPANGEDTGTAAPDGGERICSMAFGPGLTVETALFTKITAPRPAGPAGADPEQRGTPRPAAVPA